MIIGDRLKELREGKNFSQGDIEERPGLLRCHISRVENGHTVPSVETLEKFARALDVPMYALFYDGDEPPEAPKLPKIKDREFGRTAKEANYMRKLTRLLSKMSANHRNLVFELARKSARN
jgi:transcriptional regulator with XRE-family HTH domain